MRVVLPQSNNTSPCSFSFNPSLQPHVLSSPSEMMSHSQASSATATIAQNISQGASQSLLNGLHTLLPAADSRRMALQLLLDAECQVRFSLRPDNALLDGSRTSDAKVLAIAKLSLVKHLNPAWHPILEECEREVTNWANREDRVNIETSPRRTPFDELDKPLTPVSIPEPSSAPLYNMSSGAEANIQPSVSLPLPGAGTWDALDEVPLAPNPHGLSSFGNSPSLPGFYDSQLPSSRSTYSSLLPEWHCPPFASMDDDFVGSSPLSNGIMSPWASSSSIPSPPEDHPSYIRQQYEQLETHEESQTPGGSRLLRLRPTCENAENALDPFIQPGLGPESLSLAFSSSSSPTQFHSSSHSHFSLLANSPEEQSSDMGPPKKKSRRRAFERPPGLPLGPWTPEDSTPFPEELPPKKPRKVRRAPMNTPVPSTPNDQGKVLCPECNAPLLPKSLSRHLERHSNWTNGKYDAHLYCRYCFSAYSRMDSLIYHQKTDARCVQLQYQIYWKGRHAYLEEAFREWNATLGRTT